MTFAQPWDNSQLSSPYPHKCLCQRRRRLLFAAPFLSAVAHGHFLTSDCSRLIVKRILLTGYPHKIKKKFCTVERMFYNREDVEYYQDVTLFTVNGREGKIREAIGTHGNMKTQFNDTLHHGATVSPCVVCACACL